MHRVGHFTVGVWRGQAQVDCGVTYARLGSSRVSQGRTKGQEVERRWVVGVECRCMHIV